MALAQAAIVARALAAHGVQHEIVVIETAGDQRAPDTAWGEGAFVTALERALVEKRIDAAVHSAKDIPTEEDPRLQVAAYTEREGPLDALVLPIGAIGSIDQLAAGTVIGTDSPRRAGFLRAHRADLDVRPLHGNVDTRLNRLDDGAVGALLLAAAGLIRLGRPERINQLVPHSVVPPAPGQGAIAVQIRAHDAATTELVALIDHGPTRRAVEAERAFLRASGGGCRSPIGALATLSGDRLDLTGGYSTLDGRWARVEHVSGAADQGAALAQELASRLSDWRAQRPDARRVLITRPADAGPRLAALLCEQGVAGVVVPAIEIEISDENGLLADALARLADFEWAIVTSANGARAVHAVAARLGIDLSAVRWAAVGRATARQLMAAGVRDVWLPDDTNAAGLAAQLPASAGERALWVRGEMADEILADMLGERNITISSVVAYRTIEAPESSRPLLAGLLESGTLDAIVLASPSAVRGIVGLTRDGNRAEQVLAIPAVCVGRRTAQAARASGFQVIGVSETQDAQALAELTAQLLARRGAATQHGGAE